MRTCSYSQSERHWEQSIKRNAHQVAHQEDVLKHRDVIWSSVLQKMMSALIKMPLSPCLYRNHWTGLFHILLNHICKYMIQRRLFFNPSYITTHLLAALKMSYRWFLSPCIKCITIKCKRWELLQDALALVSVHAGILLGYSRHPNYNPGKKEACQMNQWVKKLTN